MRGTERAARTQTRTRFLRRPESAHQERDREASLVLSDGRAICGSQISRRWPASSEFLFIASELAEELVLRLKYSIFDFGFQAVHVARRRSPEYFPAGRKNAKMAGAHEFLFFFDPANSTAKR